MIGEFFHKLPLVAIFPNSVYVQTRQNEQLTSYKSNKSMNELKIENPFSIEEYNKNWADMKNCFLHIVKTFPNENRIVSDNDEEMQIAILKTAKQFNGNDQILFISGTQEAEQISIKYEGSNQNNKLTSFAEQQNLIKHIETFKKLVQQSLTGTLDKTVQQINLNAQQAARNQQTNLSIQAILQIIILIVAIFGIFYGIKGCSL